MFPSSHRVSDVDIASVPQSIGSSLSPGLPTPRTSSPAFDPDADAAAGGRERRVRKSVNYAEPKLNTFVVL
jgi:hypothetical protein